MTLAELVGVVDANEIRAKEVAAEFKAKTFTDVEDVLSQNLDAVSIAVPTSMHRDVALSGRVWSGHAHRKTADSIENARKIVKSAKNSGCKIMVGHIERFNPAVLKLKELIDKGELGDVLAISAKRIGPYSPRIRDVGIIIDLAVHEIDTISFLYGLRAESVYAVAGRSFHELEDYAL